MRKLQLSTPEEEWVLQRLAAREWEVGQLHATVLHIQNAQMVYQLERWPWHQTIAYAGEHGRYRIKLPRVRYENGKRRPVAEIAIYSTSRANAARQEVQTFLEQLASTP